MDTEQLIKQFEQHSTKAIEYLSERSNLEKIGKITAISVATFYTLNKCYDAFFGPLARLPGPFITRFMDLPKLVYDIPRGTMYQKLIALHEEFGETVRLGPRAVSISNKDMIKQALVTEDLVKAPIYDLFARDGTYTLFSTRDKVFHKQRRRIISPAFSIKYLNSLEPFMTSVTQTLLDKIGRDIQATQDQEGYGVTDIWVLMQCLALDVIGETAFGKTFEMIEHNNHFVPGAITHEMKAAAFRAMFPMIQRIFYPSASKTNPKLEGFLKEIINGRLQVQDGEKRKDILQSLIDSQQATNEDDRLTAEAIMTETVLFLIAGSETTSNTLGFVIIELLRHPDKLSKIYAEIDAIPLEEGQKLFSHEQLKHLPYLNAVINETLRLDAVAAGGLQRITTRDTVLGGVLPLPKGIVVSSNVMGIQTNSKHWHQPLTFKPERWIQDEHTVPNERDDLDAFIPFSLGSRNCIGKNFALQEMRVALACLLKYYDIQPIEAEMKDSIDVRHFITLTVKKTSFKIRVKHRN
ncbi:cytochrome P450 [Backusella circina FSU 941]|nr:cytochrome P450 [Backusella circina FSU 941]